MKILEITAFSAGICGLWARVLAESRLLAKKHDVTVFSSDICREGQGKRAGSYEEIDNVKIKRFTPFSSFGQNTFFWNYGKQAIKLKPDLIITHAYRQYYSTLALNLARKLKIPCFLVTHAPFLSKNLRSFKLNLAVSLYDNLIGKRILNRYDKIITITKWEVPHLLKLGVKKEKIVYIPNGVPFEFFKVKKEKENKNTILFLGRIAPIKNIETLLKSLSLTKNLRLTLIGPIEKPYGKHLFKIIRKLKLKKRVRFLHTVYDLKEKIKIIDKNEIFVLPSKREGMPQTLIEAMAREKIVVSSENDGGKELIRDKKNGFLFGIGNAVQLAEILNKIQKMPIKEKNKIKKQARISVEKFSWNKLIKQIESILEQFKK